MDRLLMEEFVAGNRFPARPSNNTNNSDDGSNGNHNSKGWRKKQWRSIADKVMDSEDEEDDDGSSSNSSGFDCNICLDSVQDPVVTLCGHLYCWPCIYKWLNYRRGGDDIDDDGDEVDYDKPSHRECPVCKSEITQSALVPLFGRGQTGGDDVSSGGGSKSAVGVVIPRRPLPPQRVVRPRDPSPPPQPPRLRRGYYSRDRPPAPAMLGGGAAGLNLDLSGRVPIPVVGMLGEIVFSGGFGNGVYGYQNAGTTPYQVAGGGGGGGSPRVRRQMMQADKSLSRVCFFLFCCVFMCILLF